MNSQLKEQRRKKTVSAEKTACSENKTINKKESNMNPNHVWFDRKEKYDERLFKKFSSSMEKRHLRPIGGKTLQLSVTKVDAIPGTYYQICPVWPLANKSTATLRFLRKFTDLGNVISCTNDPRKKEIILNGFGNNKLIYWTYGKIKEIKLTKEERVVVRTVKKITPIFLLWLRCSKTPELQLQGFDLSIALTAVAGIAMAKEAYFPAVAFGGLALISSAMETFSTFTKAKLFHAGAVKVKSQILQIFDGCVKTLNTVLEQAVQAAMNPKLVLVMACAVTTVAIWKCLASLPKIMALLRGCTEEKLQFQDITPMLLTALICKEAINPKLDMLKSYRTVSAMYRDIVGTFDIDEMKILVNASAVYVGLSPPFQIYSLIEEATPVLENAEQLLTDPKFPIIASTDTEHPVRVKQAFDEIDKVDKKIRFFRGIDGALKVRVLKARTALLDELRRLTRINKRFENRIMPLTLYFVGSPGGGKTHSLMCLVEALHNVLFDKPLDSAHKYVKSSDGYFNGYNLNSWWFHFGEFMSSTVVATNAKDSVDFLNFVGTDYAAMDMADVDSKGTMAFCSRVLTATSNDLKFASSGLADSHAIARRPHILLEPTIKAMLPSKGATRKDFDNAWDFKVPDAIKAKLKANPPVRFDHLHPYIKKNPDKVFTFSEVLGMAVDSYRRLENTIAPTTSINNIEWSGVTELQFQSDTMFRLREYHDMKSSTLIFIKDYKDIKTIDKPIEQLIGEMALVGRLGYQPEEIQISEDFLLTIEDLQHKSFYNVHGFAAVYAEGSVDLIDLMQLSLMKVIHLDEIPLKSEYIVEGNEFYAVKGDNTYHYHEHYTYHSGNQYLPLCKELALISHSEYTDVKAYAHYAVKHNITEKVRGLATIYTQNGKYIQADVNDVLQFVRNNREVQLVYANKIYYLVTRKRTDDTMVEYAVTGASAIWNRCNLYARSWLNEKRPILYASSGVVIACASFIAAWPMIKSTVLSMVPQQFQSDQKHGIDYAPLRFQTIYTDIEAKVRRNVVHMSVVSDMNSRTLATFIDSTHAYICRHSIVGKLKHVIIYGDTGTTSQVVIPASDIEISKEVYRSEKCVLTFKTPIAYIKSIASCFATGEIDITNKPVWRLMRDVDSQGNISPVYSAPVYSTYVERVRSASTVAGEREFSGYWLANQTGSYPGMCGAPYVTEQGGKLVIVGIHFAGSTSTIAFYPIYKEAQLEFNSLVVKDPTENFVSGDSGPAIAGLSLVGKMAEPSSRQPPSRIKPSVLCTAVVGEDVPDLPELNLAKATLNGPISKMALKFDRRPTMRPSEYLRMMQERDPLVFLKGFVPPSLICKKKLKGMRPTIEETILGNEYMHSLDDSTSVGPLFKYGIHPLEVKDKKELFCRETGYINERFLSMCKERIEGAERGEVVMPVVEGRLKDEVRDKTVKGVTLETPSGPRKGIVPRMFYSSDPIDIVEVKYTLGPVMELMKDVAVCTSDMVGVNPHNWNWKAMHGRILKRENFFQTDVKSCEITIMRDFSYVVFHFFNQFYCYKKGTTDWNRLYSCCFKLTRFYLFYDDYCYYIEGMNPSGQYVTCLLNGMWIYYLHSTSYYIIAKFHQIASADFEKDVTLLTFGDDSITGVSNEAPWYNKISYAKACKWLFGAVITDLSKQAITDQSTPYDEQRYMEFLQRTFREEGTEVRAPLNPSSIHKALMYGAKKMTDFETHQHYIQVMSMCLFEAMMHGLEFYEEFEGIWRPRWESLGYTWQSNWTYKNKELENVYKYYGKQASWFPYENFLAAHLDMEGLF